MGRERHGGAKRPREGTSTTTNGSTSSASASLSTPIKEGERKQPKIKAARLDENTTDERRAADRNEHVTSRPPPQSHTHSRSEGKPLHDPIYRIMHRLPRSDVLEVVKCKFGREHCERAAGYFDASFMQNPLRRLKLQVGCSGPGGLHLFFPRIFFHRSTLRTLDLSRNKLSASDVVTLCDGLGLTTLPSSQQPGNHSTGACSSASSSPNGPSALELLDLSYNLGIGNAGAVYLLSALRHNTTMRAVQLVSVSVDDEGAQQLAPLLRQRPRPPAKLDGTAASVGYTQGYAAVTEQRPYTFLLNLNHNVIGAAGTMALGKGLPPYVSVTLCKQRLKGSDNPLMKRKGRRVRPPHPTG